MNQAATDDDDAIEQLAESFVARFRAGEWPSTEEFVKRHPELADQLGDLLPTLAMLELHSASNDSQASSRQAKPIATPPPREIGDFTIVREVGRGGMGVVYEALQRSLGRHVALKVLSTPAMHNPMHLERFRFEARSAARLQHTHIVPVYGVGEHEGIHYYAMQYIAGQSLQEVCRSLSRLRQNNPPVDTTSVIRSDQTSSDVPISSVENSPWRGEGRGEGLSPVDAKIDHLIETASGLAAPRGTRAYYRGVAQIGLQVAEALAYAHSEGLLHRDIKPSNLLLDAKGNVWVTDFGLAKLEGSDGLTETGDFVGTLRYMAPERLEGAIDRRSDIYSLGATLYELVTLQVFFETSSHAKLVDQILHAAPPAPSRYDKSIPRDLETIVLKAISKEPHARYRNAEEMAEDLRRFLADLPIFSRRPAPSEQFTRWCRRNPVVASLAGAVTILLIAAIAILTVSNSRIRRESAAKDTALLSAHQAVHQLLTRVADEKFSDMPMSYPFRVALLEDAYKTYEGLVAQGDSSFIVQQQMADVLHKIAGLERDLGHNAKSEDLLQRSEAIYKSLVTADPDPPAVRASLGVVQADLAYTWQFDYTSPNRKQFPIEEKYREALATFEAIERDYPDNRQPVTLSLRSLADIANRRGDRAEAEKLWLAAIVRGQAFLDQDPANNDKRSDVTWACVEYYDAFLRDAPDRADDARAMIDLGLKLVDDMREHNPNSTQATDVLIALRFRQALIACGQKKYDEAIPLMRDSARGIQQLCVSYPWVPDFWNTAQWIHLETIGQLQKAGRSDEIMTLTDQTADWLKSLAEESSIDAEHRKRMEVFRGAVVKLLNKLGHTQQADKLRAVVLTK